LIPVAPQPEPLNFDRDVRRPGQQYLTVVQHPTSVQFNRHGYWKNVLPELRKAYNNICAYCACWIPFDAGTLDHYLPKSKHPAQAYEWSNYRLAQAKMNYNKDDSTEVLDPFHIDHGWFVLDLSTMYVRADAALSPKIRDAVSQTIDILKLNSKTLVDLRYSVLKDYSDGVPLAFLERRYPFVASELKRQGVVETIIGTVR